MFKLNHGINAVRLLVQTRSPLNALTSSVGGELSFSKDLFLRRSKVNGNVSIGPGCKIFGANLSGEISIGRYTSINGPGVTLFSKINKIDVGSFCSIARNVQIQEYNHDHLRPSTYFVLSNICAQKMKDDVVSKGAISIGNDVWIGANSIILSGVSIGNGAVVAAGSIVTRDVMSYSVVAGNPAKILGMRFSDSQIERLLKTDWYSWPVKKIIENKDFFAEKFPL